MNKHPDLHPDTPAWFVNWVERSNDRGFAKLEASLDELQGSIDNLGETLVTKLDKLQNSLDRHSELMFGTSALSFPPAMPSKELMDAAKPKVQLDDSAKDPQSGFPLGALKEAALAHARREDSASSSAALDALKAEAKADRIREEEEQAKRKAQIYKVPVPEAPARTQQETREAILDMAQKLPGFWSTHYEGTKVTIIVEGGWLTNARLKMPLDVDGTPIEVIDLAEVPARIEAFARELPGFQSCVIAADEKVHITVSAGKWPEANKMTPNMLYGYRIYLLGVYRPF